MIQLRIACNWLAKLRYEYKNVRKDVFVDGHKQLDIIKDLINFLQKMEELKSYIVNLEENNVIKPKVSLVDCIVRGNNRRPIIIITHDEYNL